MEILLIESNINTIELITNRLKDEAHLEMTSLGEEGLELAKLYAYDLIILGRMLGDSDGYQILKQLRANKVKSPILFLCGLNNADLKVQAFQYGADECLSTPFNGDEFVERVKLLVRHSQRHTGVHIQIGRLTLVPKYCTVMVDDIPIPMKGKEYDILEFLCLNKDKIVTKDRILEHLYVHEQDYPTSDVVPVWINHIRKKLSAALGEQLIQNIWGRGYMVQDTD